MDIDDIIEKKVVSLEKYKDLENLVFEYENVVMKLLADIVLLRERIKLGKLNECNSIYDIYNYIEKISI